MDIVTSGATLHLVGDFDVRSTAIVREAIYRSFSESDAVVVDLTHVDAVDVTALRVLAMATRHATRHGAHLTLRGCGPSVRRMLHISRLIRAVELEREPAIA